MATRQQKLMHEAKALGLTMLYFVLWLGVLIAIKQLVLAEYRIEFRGMSRALVGALILSKVVLVLEHVPLGAAIRAQPAWVDLLLRTGLYAAGVFVVLLLERSFDGWHEHGGFAPALKALFQHSDIDHVLVNSIVLTMALLGYNALSVVRRHLGEGGLLKLFLTPLPEGDRR